MQRDEIPSVAYRAYKAYKKGRFLETIALLDTPSLLANRDPYSIVLCAMAYLQLNKFSRIDELLSKAESIAANHPMVYCFKAFLYLKAAPNFESVLLYFGELLAKYPTDRHLAKLLSHLRSVRNFVEFQKQAKLDDFVILQKPEKKVKHIAFNAKRIAERTEYRKITYSPRILFYSVGLVISGLILMAIIYFIYQDGIIYFFNRESTISTRFAQIDQLTLDGSGFDLVERISKKKQPELYLNSETLVEDFKAAKRLIKKEKYNDALKKINKIIHSNANMSVKERTLFLKRFILAIEERQWDEIPFEEVMKAPHLYEGYAILWNGKVANLKKKGNVIIFNLLVDYREKDRFVGVAEIFSENGSEKLQNGDLVSVKGIFFNVISSSTPYLRANEVRRIQ
ncbi:MAG: hypothetical protein N2316_02695 [Spirochaetes bacterium]|nr:hypothetical protein [Spirochaetota bacterium]